MKIDLDIDWLARNSSVVDHECHFYLTRSTFSIIFYRLDPRRGKRYSSHHFFRYRKCWSDHIFLMKSVFVSVREDLLVQLLSQQHWLLSFYEVSPGCFGTHIMSSLSHSIQVNPLFLQFRLLSVEKQIQISSSLVSKNDQKSRRSAREREIWSMEQWEFMRQRYLSNEMISLLSRWSSVFVQWAHVRSRSRVENLKSILWTEL